MRQRTGQSELLFHPSGKLACQALAKLRHARNCEHRIGARLPHFRRDFEQIGIEANILLHRQIFIQAKTLRHIAEMALHLFRMCAHIDAVDHDAALVGTNDAGEHAHRGRLSCTVRADQAEYLSRLHAETEPVNRCYLAVKRAEALGEAVDFDRSGRRRAHQADPA